MIGKTISHYKILEKLGEGGMGVVYKAEDTILHRSVALKFLPPDLMKNHEIRERFLREAQAAAALAHPSICHTYEIDEVDDQVFIAMEYLEGHSLDKKIEPEPPDVNETVDIALRVAEGLKHAHKRGIVHRDIKPANIKVDEDGQAKIMDFGLAKLAGKTRLTRTATVMGTIAYMSPEQARGDKDIGQQTDIWSLGVVLYEMLTGMLPFDADTDAGLIYKIINEHPEPIGNHRSDVPDSLTSIIEKAIQKDRESRHESAEELIADLESIKSGVSISTESSSPSIAVLPFVDMSPAKDQEYFCDGISETLINELTQFENITVIARTSAFSFKDQNLDVREIGRKLGVKNILEGSIQKAGNRIRITAQLVDTSRGRHLWSEKYDRELDDIFAIQDEITETIVERLKPKLLAGEKTKLIKRQTVGLETYDLYLKGRYFLNKFTAEGLDRAIDLFKQAIAIDQDYALAFAGLADCFHFRSFYTPSPPGEAYQQARRAAIRALEIDNTLAEAHTSLADIKSAHDWDWKGAENELKQAIELNPGYAMAHEFYAVHLARVARFEEAFEEIEQALRLDPFSLHINTFVGGIFYYARQYDRAIEALQKTIEMDPRFPYAHAFLAVSYLFKGMPEEALAELQREKEISVSWNTPAEAGIGALHGFMGNRDETVKILNTFLGRLEEEYIPPTLLAFLYFSLGEIDQGFEWLEKAYDSGDNFLCYAKVDATYDDIRNDNRFKALLKKMGLEK